MNPNVENLTANGESRSPASGMLGVWVSRLKLLLHRCSKDGCWSKGGECYLPDNEDGKPDDYACPEHARDLGYCYVCGQFWGGISSFDFRQNGLCDNCDHEMRADSGELDEPDDYDCFPDPYA